MFNNIGPITIPRAQDSPLIICREDPLLVKSVLVSQAGETHRLLFPDEEDAAVENQELAVTLPVAEVGPLVQRLETYLKAKKIASKVFSRMVLGVSDSVFSNMKRKAKTLPKLAEKELVLWGRVQFYLDNLATPTSSIKSTESKVKGKGKGKGRGKRSKGEKSLGIPGASIDCVDKEVLLAEDSLANVQQLPDVKLDGFVLPDQDSPGETLLQTEELFFDYPDFKQEELTGEIVFGPSELDQIEVYCDVLPQ